MPAQPASLLATRRGKLLLLLLCAVQNVLGLSPILSGSAYLPVTAGIVVAAGISSRLSARIGTRPVIVAGALIAAGGAGTCPASRSAAPIPPACSPGW